MGGRACAAAVSVLAIAAAVPLYMLYLEGRVLGAALANMTRGCGGCGAVLGVVSWAVDAVVLGLLLALVASALALYGECLTS